MSERGPRVAIGGLLFALVSWQIAAAAWVRLDYYDGYETVINARYLIGDAPTYISVRFPFMAFWIAPAEALRGWLELHPLELRPAHLASGVLHVLYLWIVFQLLARRFESGWAVALGFASAIPTYLYFSSAPFLSHDVAPGAALLAMLVLGDRQLRAPSTRRWWLLVAVGAGAALVKPVYGLFWPVSWLALVVTSRRSSTQRGFASLAAAAVASAVICWAVLAAVLPARGEVVPFWQRPWTPIQGLFTSFGGEGTSPWIYLLNAPAFGAIAVALIVPGLFMAWRSDRLARAVALSWTAMVVIFHLLPRHEVRYLAFLAPLTAFLIVPPIGWLLQRSRVTAVALVACGLLTWLPSWRYSPSSSAMEIATPFQRNPELLQLLAPLDRDPRPTPVLVFADWLLRFEPQDGSPLAGDPLHRLFHFAPHQLRMLYGYRKGEVRVGKLEQLATLDRITPGTAIVWSGTPSSRPNGRPWQRFDRVEGEQWSGIVREIPLAPAGRGWGAADPEVAGLRVELTAGEIVIGKSAPPGWLPLRLNGDSPSPSLLVVDREGGLQKDR